VFGLDLFDPLDVVGLLQAAVASLLPIAQDLLQVADLELFQVHALEVNLLVIGEFADLAILLFQLFADLESGHSPRHGLGHLTEDTSGRISSSSQEVTESVFFSFEILAERSESIFDFFRLGKLVLGQCACKSLQGLDTNFTFSSLQGRAELGSDGDEEDDDQGLHGEVQVGGDRTGMTVSDKSSNTFFDVTCSTF